MDIYLLFRKKSPLTEEGLPWLRGALEHEFAARRNSTGRAVVSAVLVRSLLACLDGAVQYAEANSGDDIVARVRSSSAPSSHAICAWKGSTFYIPHGEANKITYHAGVLAMLRALARPTQAADFWGVYQALQSAYILHGKAPDIQESLCRACDELYYWARYANLDAQPENDLLASAAITANTGVESGWDAISLDLAPLTDPSALQRLRGNQSPIILNARITASYLCRNQGRIVKAGKYRKPFVIYRADFKLWETWLSSFKSLFRKIVLLVGSVWLKSLSWIRDRNHSWVTPLEQMFCWLNWMVVVVFGLSLRSAGQIQLQTMLNLPQLIFSSLGKRRISFSQWLLPM